MAQNITVQGASYADVPAVVLPKTGGGTASFTDVSDTTAAAGDVLAGEYFYTAAGVRTLGTGYSVTSVNTQTGAVVLNAGDVGATPVTTKVTKTSADTSQTLAENTFYVWPEMSALTITCPATGGPYAFRFVSGLTPTTLSITGAVMPDDFTVEPLKVYDIIVYEGYATASSWDTTVYILDNGSYTFSQSNGTTVTVTNHKHVTVDLRASSGWFAINFMQVSDNTTGIGSWNNINYQDKKFTIPAGSSVELKVLNVTDSEGVGKKIGMRKASVDQSAVIETSEFTTTGTTQTKTIVADTDIGSFYLYSSSAKVTTISFDVEFYVDGVQWI